MQIDNYIAQIDQHLQRKPYYSHVRGIIPISNCRPDDPGLAKLRQTIIKVSNKEPYWGAHRQTKWLLLATKLDKERADRPDEPVMTTDDVVQAGEGVGMTRDDVEAFLKLYHKLGELIYFEEAELRDIVILSPQWLGKTFRLVVKDDQQLQSNLINPSTSFT